jgi:peptide/nickel transport system substrate-binding protein
MKTSPHLIRIQAIIACAVISAMTMAACAAPAAAPTATPPATTGPKYGGTLQLAYVQDITFLDPIRSTTIADLGLPYLYADTLVRWAGKNDEEPKIVPGLATSWDISPDGMTYTFHLRQGVKFQNLPPVNGREFTSDDVKFNVGRLIDPKTKSPYGPSAAAAIDRIETPDKYTAIYKLKRPEPALLMNIAAGTFGILAREVIERDGDADKTVIGTGPFMFEKYRVGVGVSFVRNPDYWDKGKPYLERVELTAMPDAGARLAAFRAGKIDRITDGVTNMQAIKGSVPGAQIVPGISLVGSCLEFNLQQTDKPWGDKKVRQALQYAIDYDGLIAAVLNGAGVRTDFLDMTFKDWGARQLPDLPKYDPAKARALLADAGYPNGFKTTLLQHTNRMDAWGGAAEPVAAQLKAVGVEAQIIPLGQADYIARLRTGQYEMATGALHCSRPEIDLNLTPMFQIGGSANRTGYKNPRVQELIDLQKKAVADVPLRQKYVKEIMSILADDQPVVPLFRQYDFHIAQPWVKGWNNAADPSVALAWYEVANVWLDKK